MCVLYIHRYTDVHIYNRPVFLILYIWDVLHELCTCAFLWCILMFSGLLFDSVQFLNSMLGFGSQGRSPPAILWIVTQSELLHRLYLCSEVFNSGFCLHFVIWLLFKLQSPFFHDCSWGFLLKSFSPTWNALNFFNLYSWRNGNMRLFFFFCLLETTAGQYLTCCAFSLCVLCRVPFAFCLLRRPAGLNCLCSVPPTENWEVKCMCMLLMCLWLVQLHASRFRATTPNVFRK